MKLFIKKIKIISFYIKEHGVNFVFYYGGAAADGSGFLDRESFITSLLNDNAFNSL